jgi:hypothetical protein
MDDVRLTGSLAKECKQAGRRAAMSLICLEFKTQL